MIMPRLYPTDDLNARDEDLLARLARFVRATFARYHRFEVYGAERIPRGAGLYVGNHSGALLSIDTFLWGSHLVLDHGMHDVPYGLAHSVVLDIPQFNRLLVPMGALKATHDNAAKVFDAGNKALVYPGGDVDTLRPFWQRDRVKFGGRAGFIRLAARHGVPIIPVVAKGAHDTIIVFDDLEWLPQDVPLLQKLRTSRWPLMFSLPWGLTLGPSPPYFPLPTKIRVTFGEPIYLDRDGPAAADHDWVHDEARKVRWRLQTILDEME